MCVRVRVCLTKRRSVLLNRSTVPASADLTDCIYAPDADFSSINFRKSITSRLIYIFLLLFHLPNWSSFDGRIRFLLSSRN